MSKQVLYLMRHAEAVASGTPGYVDDERPLLPRGEKTARRMGRVLARCGLAAEAIVTSPLPRARRTAELVAEALGLEGRLENSPELVASRSEIQVTDWLRTRPERTLLIVGHDPWITDLVGKLAGAPGMQVRMAKAGVARLDRNDDQTVWELKWLVSPKLLLRVGE